MLDLLNSAVAPADILAYARAVPDPAGFRLTAAGGPVSETQINNIKYRIKNLVRTYNTATFRAYDSETKQGRRDIARSVLEGILPPLGVKFTVGELESILASLAAGTPNQDLVDSMLDDAYAGVIGVKSRMELAAGDLITDGKFTLNNEGGVTIEADFQVPGANTPTVANYWNTGAGTPIDDEKAWNRLLRTTAGSLGAATEAWTSDLVIGYLAQSQQYKDSFYGTVGQSRPTLNLDNVNTVRRSNGLPVLVDPYDQFVVVDGVSTRTTPENRFFMFPADKTQLAQTQYGITAEAIMLKGQGGEAARIIERQAPGIVVTAKIGDDPIHATTRTTAAAMPVMYAPNSYISARVLA